MFNCSSQCGGYWHGRWFRDNSIINPNAETPISIENDNNESPDYIENDSTESPDSSEDTNTVTNNASSSKNESSASVSSNQSTSKVSNTSKATPKKTPRVWINKMYIKSKTTVIKLKSNKKGIIYYTTNGNNPTVKSKKYKYNITLGKLSFWNISFSLMMEPNPKYSVIKEFWVKLQKVMLKSSTMGIYHQMKLFPWLLGFMFKKVECIKRYKKA